MHRSISITSKFVPSAIPVVISFAAAATVLLSTGGLGGLSSAAENCGKYSEIILTSAELDRRCEIEIYNTSVRAITVVV